jgi:hypothetical protein
MVNYRDVYKYGIFTVYTDLQYAGRYIQYAYIIKDSYLRVGQSYIALAIL